MPGRTGKRAKPPGRCVDCGKPIEGVTEFCRDREGDYHTDCYWTKLQANIPQRPATPGRDETTETPEQKG